MQSLSRFILQFLASLALCGLTLWCHAAIARWDAMPAIDVQHLRGAYVGKNVCPMCRHGYDAGILQFLPGDTSPAKASALVALLRQSLSSPRFRVFVVLTDTNPNSTGPSEELLGAVDDANPSWFVARLKASDQPQANRDFKENLQARAITFVFAQRRLLGRFVDLDALPSNALREKLDVIKLTKYSLQFLAETYAQVNESTNPDTPKGQLWLAPNELANTLVLSTSASESRSICLHERELAPMDALINLNQHWARTDAHGCLTLRGQLRAGDLLRAFVPNQPTRVLRLDGALLNKSRLEFRRTSNNVNKSQVAQSALDSHQSQAAQSAVDSHQSQAARSAVDSHQSQAAQSALDSHQSQAAQSAVDSHASQEIIVGLPCDGCEAVFQGMPNQLSWQGVLAPANEPGEKLQLNGTVRDKFGRPRADVIVYAHQTNHLGVYPTDPNAALHLASARHGRLRAWARTNAIGYYQFESIRPGSYPNTNIAQHIHLQVIEPGRCTYYIDDVVFSDDPKLSADARAIKSARGGSGLVVPSKSADGAWRAQRDIVLGQAIPNYESCERANTGSR
jgi:protocatechuate 3,4-dioxygenase beta subunit